MVDKNYLHTAYANSADGTNGFTTVYPNLNLLDGTTKSSKTTTIYKNDNFGVIYWNPKQLSEKTITGSVYLDLTHSPYDVWLQLYTTNGVLYGNTIKAGQKGYSRFSGKVATITDNNANIAFRTLTGVTDTITFDYSELKIEPGSTATPYMPSASEVTTADWPKYVGTYVDTNPVSSTVTSKYDWDEMKYRVYLDGIPVGGSKLLSFDLENLKAGTSYNVQVSQINGKVESDKSKSVAFKTTLIK